MEGSLSSSLEKQNFSLPLSYPLSYFSTITFVAPSTSPLVTLIRLLLYLSWELYNRNRIERERKFFLLEQMVRSQIFFPSFPGFFIPDILEYVRYLDTFYVCTRQTFPSPSCQFTAFLRRLGKNKDIISNKAKIT